MMMMMVVVEMMVMEMMVVVVEMMVMEVMVEMMVMMIMGGGYLLHLSYNAMVYELVAHTVKSQIELSCLFSVTHRVQKREAQNDSKSN